MNTFYISAALALYAVSGWFAIAAMIQGVRAARAKAGFNSRAYLAGFAIVTIALAAWAFDSSGAMVQCMKKHSEVTCRAAIR